MKVIIESLAKIAKRKAWMCECSTGLTIDANGNKTPNGGCEKCAELRKVADMCWHERKEIFYPEHKWVCSCGLEFKTEYMAPNSYEHIEINSYPTPDIPALRSYMEIVGVWEKFRHWLWNNTPPDMTSAPFTDPFERMFCIWIACMDILTSDKFYPAVEEFLIKEVEG